MWTVAADEGVALVAFEEAEALTFQRAAEILHELHGEALLVLHFAAEQGEQGRGEAFPGDVAGNCSRRDGSDGIRGVRAQKVRFHFRDALECGGRLRAFRQRLGGDGEPVRGGRQLLLPFCQEGLVLLYADARLVVIQRHVREALAMEPGDVALIVMVIRRPEERAGESADGDRGPASFGSIQSHSLRAVVFRNGAGIQNMAHGFLPGEPERSIRLTLKNFRRAAQRWSGRRRLAFLWFLCRWRSHALKAHAIALACLHKKPAHIKDGEGAA